jgi:spermidine synthase
MGYAVAFGLPVLICFLFSNRPLRFGLGLGAVLFISLRLPGEEGRLLYAERSFFGIHRVTVDETGSFHRLIHGRTLHGMQSLDPEHRREPLPYYHSTSPVGQLFAAYGPDLERPVAVVGLGAGGLACYSRTNQSWTFYEIDPVVKRLAQDPRFFTFMQDAQGNVRIVMGDARLSLQAAPDQHFGLFVLDAYSSDSIPVHLLTREAVQLYLKKLAPHGLLAFHVSNRHLQLVPVVANLARDAGLICFYQDDSSRSPEENALGKFNSEWMVMAREDADLSRLAKDARWLRKLDDARVPVWTDNFSSILRVFDWSLK